MIDNIQELQIPLNPTRDEKKWIRNSYNWGGAVLLIQFTLMAAIATIVTAIATAVVLMRTGKDFEAYNQFVKGLQGMSFTMLLANIIASVISYPTAFFIGCKGLKIKTKDFFSTKGCTVKFIALSAVVCMAVQFFGSTAAGVITEIFKHFGITLTTIDTSIKTDMASNVLMFLLACVCAPIFEEMIFRGLLLKALSKISIPFGIIASAAMFGLFHQNIPQAVNAFVIGIAFGYIAYKSGSIIPTMIIHCILNLSALLLESAANYLKDYSDVFMGIWVALITAAAILILILNKKKFSLPKGTPQKKKRTLPILITSWSIILIIALDIVFTVTTSIELP